MRLCRFYPPVLTKTDRDGKNEQDGGGLQALKTTFSLGCFLVVNIIIINLLIAGFNRRGEELLQLEGGADPAEPEGP